MPEKSESRRWRVPPRVHAVPSRAPSLEMETVAEAIAVLDAHYLATKGIPAGVPIAVPIISPEITSSTRRFFCRPSAVSLEATG